MIHPMISVVMPVYNGEKYLHEAIDSILNQTYTEFEFIILNDGSTDKTEEIILSYDDPRIVYVKNETNLQIVKTLNKGIELAQGKYIARMDADDISLPERFEKQIGFLEKHTDVHICGGWLKTFGKRNEIWKYPIIHEEIRSALLFDSALAHPSIMARKYIFESYVYDESYNKAEDYNLWVDLSEKYILHNIPEILLSYRLHPNQTERDHQNIVANAVRTKMLKNLGCHLDEIETNSFLKIASGEFVAIEKVEAIFSKILLANSKSNYLDQNALSFALGQRFWIAVNFRRKYHPSDLYKFKKSFLREFVNISLVKYIKFHIKCLLALDLKP